MALRRFPAGMREVILVAKIAERLATALRSAIITDRGSAVGALSNGCPPAAHRVANGTVFVFDLAGGKHC